jgi:hypothetical protein
VRGGPAARLLAHRCRVSSRQPRGLSEETLVQAATQALAQHASRGNKQAEEHYYRKTNDHPRTENICERMESALKQVALEPLARNYLTRGAAPKAAQASENGSVDDGVQLR